MCDGPVREIRSPGFRVSKSQKHSGHVRKPNLFIGKRSRVILCTERLPVAKAAAGSPVAVGLSHLKGSGPFGATAAFRSSQLSKWGSSAFKKNSSSFPQEVS